MGRDRAERAEDTEAGRAVARPARSGGAGRRRPRLGRALPASLPAAGQDGRAAGTRPRYRGTHRAGRVRRRAFGLAGLLALAGRWRRALPAAAAGGRPVPCGAARSPARDSGLVSAVWALPARQREVLVLRYFADLPENQVAAATGLSEDAVRSQVALAFSALRAELPSAD